MIIFKGIKLSRMSRILASPSPDDDYSYNQLATQKKSINQSEKRVFILRSKSEKFDPDFMHELIDLSDKISQGFAANQRNATTTISSTTKQLTQAWKRLALKLSKNKNSKLANALKRSYKNAAIASGLQDHTLKSNESTKDKKNSSHQENLNIKDSVRCTTKLSHPFDTKEEFLESIQTSINSIKNDPNFDNCFFIDRKFKCKANVYCDLSLYFLITIGKKLRIVEIQVLTEDYFIEKAHETAIYKEAKKICANLNLGYKKGADTDLFYAYFRSVLEKFGPEIFSNENSDKLRLEITKYLANFIKNSQDLVNGIYLKNSKVPKYDIINPSIELINDLENVAHLFLKSYNCYSNKTPLIKSLDDLRWLNKETEDLLQVPKLLDNNGNPNKEILNSFITDDNLALIRQKLDYIYSDKSTLASY